MRSAAGRQVRVGAALVLACGLAACGSGSPDPAGSGGLVGHLSGTSDVEGQPGDPALGGSLAAIPIAAMEDRFWRLSGVEPVADPRGWSYLAAELSEAQVDELGGTVAPVDGDGDFRIVAPPGEYAVCYWDDGFGGRSTGCDAVELPAEGELEASWGEAGFNIAVAD